jgi:serine/threonine protein kinase
MSGVLASSAPDVVRCQHCQAANTRDARYCEKCGMELANPEATTLVFDPREMAGRRGTPGEAEGNSGGGLRRPSPTGKVPVLTHTLSGHNADALLQLVRRELADDYDVEREIGRGGMAIVYRAVERQLRRPVALKVLPPELMLGTGVVERFEREAQMAAALDHSSIIPIYRVGQTASLAYLAMRYIEGRALDRIISEQGALPIPVVLLVLRAATGAVAYAHAHGIVHRDIKGGNILVDRDGRVVVTDFGVARAIDNASMTTTGSVIGTPYFMSPEQCAGKVAAPQSDQYSLGVVAFQMLTGAVPFQADTLAAIMHHHFFTPPPDVTKVREDIPDALGAILTRVLSKDPERRYATTADMLAAVEAVPLGDADRANGEAMLKSVAQGTALPAVRTSALPPLADTMSVVAAHDAFMRSADRRKRVRRRVSGASAIVVASVLGLWLWRRPAPTRGAGPADSTRTGPPGLPRPTPGAQVLPVSAPTRPSPPPVESSAASRHHTTTIPSPAAPPAPPAVAPDTSTGKLRVRAFPGDALIQIDNETIGQGAVVDRDILAGERHLRITAPGYTDFDTTIVVKAGETTRLSAIELKAMEP